MFPFRHDAKIVLLLSVHDGRGAGGRGREQRLVGKQDGVPGS